MKPTKITQKHAQEEISRLLSDWEAKPTCYPSLLDIESEILMNKTFIAAAKDLSAEVSQFIKEADEAYVKAGEPFNFHDKELWLKAKMLYRRCLRALNMRLNNTLPQIQQELDNVREDMRRCIFTLGEYVSPPIEIKEELRARAIQNELNERFLLGAFKH